MKAVLVTFLDRLEQLRPSRAILSKETIQTSLVVDRATEAEWDGRVPLMQFGDLTGEFLKSRDGREEVIIVDPGEGHGEIVGADAHETFGQPMRAVAEGRPEHAEDEEFQGTDSSNCGQKW